MTIRHQSSFSAFRRYVVTWVWLFSMSVAAIVIYDCLLEYIEDLAIWLLGLDDEARPDGLVGVTLRVVAGVLFWWRWVKVTVFLGSPFRVGLTVEYLRENGAEVGRPVTVAFIEDVDLRGILFGVVAKSHPRSDKIVRSRVEAVVMALPFGRSFVVRGSRLYLPKLDVVESRKRFFEYWESHHRYWHDHKPDWTGMTTVELIRQTEPPRTK